MGSKKNLGGNWEMFSSWGEKFWDVILDVSWDVGRDIRILMKKLIA
jgi:hypothetical protein